MNNKKEALGSVNEGMRSLVDIISSKLTSGQSQGKELFSSLSKNLKGSIKDSIFDTSEKAAAFIYSLKKDKIRSLEKLLNLDKKDLMASNKKSFIYSNEAG